MSKKRNALKTIRIRLESKIKIKKKYQLPVIDNHLNLITFAKNILKGHGISKKIRSQRKKNAIKKIIIF